MTIKEKDEVLKYFKEMVCDRHLPIGTFGNVPDLDGDFIWYKHRMYLVNYTAETVIRPKIRCRLRLLLMSIKCRYFTMRKNMILLTISKKQKRRSTNKLLVLLYIGIFFTAISSFFTP